MLKRMLLLAMAALTALAIGGTATASAAVWTEEGVPLNDTTVSLLSAGAPPAVAQAVGFAGQLKVQGELGTIECTVDASGEIAPKDESQIDEAEFSNCKTTGLINHCAASATAGALPWGVEAYNKSGSPVVHFTDVEYTVAMTGFLCPNVTFSGTLTATPDNSNAMTTVTLSGKLSSSAGTHNASGSLGVSPTGTYGVGIAKNSRPIELDGDIKLGGELGGWECSYHLDGSIESLTDNGRVTSFQPSSCKPFGSLGHCSVSAYDPVGLPWSISAEDVGGEKFIRVSEPHFTVKLSGFLCPSQINGTGGTLDLTPSNPSAMYGMSASGTLKSSSGNFAASGDVDLTPAGQYGIG